MSPTPPPPSAGSPTAFPSFSTVNYYAGSTLNRLSWLRTSSSFLNSALASPLTRFVLLKDLNPLVFHGGEHDGQLATLGWREVEETLETSKRLSGGSGDGLFGPSVYGIENSAGDKDEKAFCRVTDGLGPNNLALVFLGIDESQLESTSLPGELAASSGNKADGSEGTAEAPAGTPYFALSLSYVPPGMEAEQVPTNKLLQRLEESGKYAFLDMRSNSKTKSWKVEEAAIVAQAKSLVDWNERYLYCPACARRQYTLWAGYKRGCSSSLTLPSPASASDSAYLTPYASANTTPCTSTQTLSNFHYPRTDPVIIMAVLSADGNSVLLGRQKKWPNGFVSCLAGFCEPGESFEEAVRREVLEESGVKVEEVVYHSSQPWPYPTNLMAGFFGIASAASSTDAAIRLDLDNELSEARFYSREEILAYLDGKGSDRGFTKQELALLDEKVKVEGKATSGGTEEAVRVRLPPETAIARVLITAWARNEAFLPNQKDGVETKTRTRM